MAWRRAVRLHPVKPGLRSRKFVDMKLIRGGAFLMGSDVHYPEEAPRRSETVGDFWIDIYPVANRAFAQFVDATGYVTLAELPPNPEDYPGMAAGLAQPGSAVFAPPDGPVPLSDPSGWWRFVIGANWRHPTGPDSSIEGIMDHPVVQVAYADAEAYARWAGKSLPTEAQWEFAARGGRFDGAYAWGDELAPGGQMLANYWQGEFPWRNTLEDGYLRTSPVGAYPPNGYGLYDMIGNTWEWTATAFNLAKRGCCAPVEAGRSAGAEFEQKALKGGSHLCAENYCQRYRPAARYPQPVDSPTSHIGFRCVVRR